MSLHLRSRSICDNERPSSRARAQLTLPEFPLLWVRNSDDFTKKKKIEFQIASEGMLLHPLHRGGTKP